MKNKTDFSVVEEECPHNNGPYQIDRVYRALAQHEWMSSHDVAKKVDGMKYTGVAPCLSTLRKAGWIVYGDERVGRQTVYTPVGRNQRLRFPQPDLQQKVAKSEAKLQAERARKPILQDDDVTVRELIQQAIDVLVKVEARSADVHLKTCSTAQLMAEVASRLGDDNVNH